MLSVLRTLSYSDVFDYPLSLAQIHYFLQTDTPLSLFELRLVLSKMSKHILKQKGFYAFSGKKEIIMNRLRGEKIVSKKIALGKNIARTLMVIPSVLFIGISGAVAGGSATESDDIDFFVITQAGTLYTTRLLLLSFLQLRGKRRGRNESEAKDKICLNMLIDESSLLFTKDRHDLYTAREITQIIPLFERGHMYTLFLEANKWTQDILPNAKGLPGCQSIRRHSLLASSLCSLEPLLRHVQSLFMKRHRTSETISNSFLAFHPRDMKKYILSEYEKKVRHYIKCYTI